MVKIKHVWIFVLGIFLGFSSIYAQDLPEIIKKIEPSVVVIFTYDKRGNGIAQGSGFIINNKGDVITNYHVIEGAYKAEVKTIKGNVYPIKKVLADDKESDIVHVSTGLSQSEIFPIDIASTFPDVGEKVIVIGSPLGLEQTVTDGIVSAIREIEGFGKIIQISAPISPGSSGSPVVNVKGQVIGIATFQMIEGQNLNFAIPGERIVSLKPGSGKGLQEIKEDYIRPEDASKYVGEVITVCGYVVSTKYASKSKGQPTFLNLDKPYPDQIFIVVIWGNDRHLFNRPPEKKYKGKNICVTGQIIIYRGIPEIIVEDPSQIIIR